MNSLMGPALAPAFSVPVFAAGNPFFPKQFFSDPSVHVIDGRVYVYPSQDAPGETDYKQMDGYHVLSSEDLVNWTDHGEFLRSTDIPWAEHSMWAPEGGIKGPDGRYLFFFPDKDKDNKCGSEWSAARCQR